MNPEEIARIVRVAIYHREVLNPRRSVRRVVHHPWPWEDTVSYETDNRGLVEEVSRRAEEYVRYQWDHARADGATFFGNLVGMRDEAVRDGDTYRRNCDQVSNENTRIINSQIASADRTGRAVLPALTFVRNTSASVLLAGATVVSGGAAAALIAGAGAGLRFTSRLQDGGTVAQAAQETAIDLVVTAVTRGAGRALPQSPLNQLHVNTQNASVLAILGIATNTAADVAKTMVTGEIGRTPLQGNHARIGMEAVNAILTNLLGRISLSVSLRSSQQAVEAIEGATLGWLGDQVVNYARGTDSNSTSSSNNNSNRGPGGVVPPNTLLAYDPAFSSADQWVRAKAMRLA